MNAEEIFNLEMYTDEGQQEIKKVLEVFEKMVSNINSEEIEILTNFGNNFQFGLYELFNAKLKEIKPELYK